MIEICAVGGYNEVGRNMTALKIDDVVILLDMGIYLESYIKFTDDEEIAKATPFELIKAGAVPNINRISDWKKDVKLIIPSHAHLDHCGAIPFIANNFPDAQVLCTPFTAAVINEMIRDEGIRLQNKVKVLNVNSSFRLSKDILVEFINSTHSTPETVMIAIHTPYGVVLYAVDFKFDLFPVLGQKPNFKRLKELGRKGILALIVDSTYAELAQKTPSESVAKQMLRDVMLGTESKDKAVIVTTFSSHMQRLKSIVEFGRAMNRKVVFLGRSLAKYSNAAREARVIDFNKKVEIVKYSNQIQKRLKKIMREGKGRYLLVVTGHQGETKSVLAKMASGELSFNFGYEDHVIFSCKIIPNPVNLLNREVLETNLKQQGVRIFRDIHVSGHAAREDLRDLINMVKPRHIIPAHGELRMTSALSNLAVEMGYEPGKSVHIIQDGQRMVL